MMSTTERPVKPRRIAPRGPAPPGGNPAPTAAASAASTPTARRRWPGPAGCKAPQPRAGPLGPALHTPTTEYETMFHVRLTLASGATRTTPRAWPAEKADALARLARRNPDVRDAALVAATAPLLCGCGGPLECYEGEFYCPDCTRAALP